MSSAHENHHMHHAMNQTGNLTDINASSSSSSASSNGHSCHDSMNHQGSMSHGMMMALHFGVQETIVFPSWTTTTSGELFGSCVVLLLLGILFEGIKLLREQIARKKLLFGSSSRVNSEVDVKQTNETQAKQKYIKNITSVEHLLQTLLHVIQFMIGYFIMLAFMICNYWLCFSIIIGIGVGYFFFGFRRIREEECCH